MPRLQVKHSYKINKNLPRCVMQGGSSHGRRAYKSQDGGYSFYPSPGSDADSGTPWHFRSTVNKSPLWGIRSGTAVESQRRRFSNCWWHSPSNAGGTGMRLHMIIYRRRHWSYYRGRFSRWD